MLFGEVRFQVVSHTAWAPGLDTEAAWLAWAHGRLDSLASSATSEPKLKDMPAMLRRRASTTGKMALEAAYHCLPDAPDTPVIFASRHGECARSVALLQELVMQLPLSPATFSLSVHNANAGLLSIARGDRSNHLAIAAGAATVEHALIEACGLLADGASQVLLVVSDSPLPDIFLDDEASPEPPFAWAWLLQKQQVDGDADSTTAHFCLSWGPQDSDEPATSTSPAMLDILGFFLRGDDALSRITNNQQWRWSRHG